LNRLAPKKNRREEMERVTMLSGFDAGTYDANAPSEAAHFDQA
jgi:hypothetical protein